jgi:Fe-S cluster assembly ATP-binding protein
MTMNNQGHLEIRDLSITLGSKPVLRNLSIDFWPGHVHALVGPNGAGKSTLAATIMGLAGYERFDGDLLLDGESLRGVPIDERARRGVTLGWQEPARYEGLGVRDFILAGSKTKLPGTVRECLSRVGLDPAAYGRRAVDKTLSGGERKRIELASILAMEPRIVLLDEPDSGIDVDALNRIFDAIRTLKELGATVILITHSLTVLRQAEHAFLLCDGQIVDKGKVERIAGYFEKTCIPCDTRDAREVAAGGSES